jgi:hypothetical protein
LDKKVKLTASTVEGCGKLSGRSIKETIHLEQVSVFEEA